MNRENDGVPKKAGVPAKWGAWGGSLLFHLCVLLLLIFFFQFRTTGRAAPGQDDAVAGIVLKKTTDTGTSYVDSTGHEFSDASPDSAPSMEELLSAEFSDAILSESLPNSAIGPSGPTGPTLRVVQGGSAQLSGVGGGFGTGLGGKVKVDLFGTEGTGSKFVYVFDRSGSMNDYGGRPFRAAKEQLLRSLEPLTDFQQFNIIFYNENFTVWKPGLPFATEPNKEGAATFVRGRVATGGTKHYEPLIAAIRLNPDVIFFLTDGEEKDALNPGQIADIRRINRNGIQINAIQFGVGSERTDRNFLRTLAAQNQGQYQYINVAELRENAP